RTSAPDDGARRRFGARKGRRRDGAPGSVGGPVARRAAGGFAPLSAGRGRGLPDVAPGARSGGSAPPDESDRAPFLDAPPSARRRRRRDPSGSRGGAERSARAARRYRAPRGLGAPRVRGGRSRRPDESALLAVASGDERRRGDRIPATASARAARDDLLRL